MSSVEGERETVDEKLARLGEVVGKLTKMGDWRALNFNRGGGKGEACSMRKL